MELDRFYEFSLVAKYGSIKKAAQELGVSAAVLSARIIRLEEQLGCPLFIRGRDGMSLTENAVQFLPRAKELLEQQQELKQNMRSAQSYAYHRLRIAISGSGLPIHLGPYLDKLNLTYPSMKLELMDDQQFGIETGILSREVDIYFAPTMEDYAPAGLQKLVLAASSQYVILPKAHPLAERPIISIKDLEGEQFILYPKTAETAIRDFQLRNLLASDIHFTIYDSSTSVIFYKLLVPVGKGILLLPTPAMDLPPNTVCIPLSPVPHPAAPCCFFDPHSPSENVREFVSGFQQFSKGSVKHEHGISL